MTTDRPSESTSPPPVTPASHAASTQFSDFLSTLSARLGLNGPRSLRDTIERALREGDSTETTFSAEERAMLRRLLRFGKSRVEDVMVPRADIIAIDDSESIQDLLRTFDEAGVSRVPVFAGTLDDPHGMIHIKDLFRWLLEDAARNGTGKSTNQKGAKAAKEQNGTHTRPRAATPAAAKGNGNNKKKSSANGHKPAPAQTHSESQPGDNSPVLDLGTVDLSRPVSITKIKRPLLFVPPSMPAMNLLIRMQSTRNHMALVIDEYGGTDGLVTIEDLVEQIVGDIEDEHDDTEQSHIIHDPKQGLFASARTPIDELSSHLGCTLVSAQEEEEIDTLGGLVFALVGRVPSRGEIVRHPNGIEFEVLDADPRRIKTLKVHVPQFLEPNEELLTGAKSENPK